MSLCRRALRNLRWENIHLIISSYGSGCHVPLGLRNYFYELYAMQTFKMNGIFMFSMRILVYFIRFTTYLIIAYYGGTLYFLRFPIN